MLSLDDSRWAEFMGGYRRPFDPRPAFRSLELGTDIDGAWEELWQELHHQGDVGEASYAAVPHLVRIHRQRSVVDWNTYAIVGTIELARDRGDNPPVPDWLRVSYDHAIDELAQIGLAELPRAADQEAVRSILSILAIWKGARTYGRVLAHITEDEVLELETQMFDEPGPDEP